MDKAAAPADLRGAGAGPDLLAQSIFLDTLCYDISEHIDNDSKAGMHHHRHHGAQGHHGHRGHGSAGRHHAVHHGGERRSAYVGQGPPAAAFPNAGSSPSTQPRAVTLETARSLHADPTPTCGGCPKTGGSGECLGDCQTCPNRGI